MFNFPSVKKKSPTFEVTMEYLLFVKIMIYISILFNGLTNKFKIQQKL